MTHAAVVLSVAHHPDPAGYEPGATAMLDGILRTEAAWSLAMCRRIEAILLARGYPTILLNQPLAATIAALRSMPRGTVVVAMEPHLNADPDSDGPGTSAADYGLVIRDARNTSAPMARFCERFCDRLALSRVAAGLRADVRQWTAPLQGTKTIGFVQRHPHPAVVTEAAFIDHEPSLRWVHSPDGMDAIAAAHVSAVQAGWSHG